jgi:hypothetical protein
LAKISIVIITSTPGHPDQHLLSSVHLLDEDIHEVPGVIGVQALLVFLEGVADDLVDVFD